MITYQQADYLINLKKKIVEDNKTLDNITIEQVFPFDKRFELIAESDNEFTFLWKIWQSAKNTLGISLHFQEDESKIGLLRIDYGGGHKNPEIANDFVPEMLAKYAGTQMNVPHIHYYVQGYKTLDWAIPLTESNFEIKELDTANFNNSFADVIKLFAKTINIETKITINTLLI